MSPVSIGLDALLILLLVTAVAVGVRLNRKLKDLRDSQVGFIKAVGELDAAALRAESGLQALREATTEAHDQLLTRIETARGLAARLDRVLPETETAIAEARAATEAANDAATAARRAAAIRPAASPAPAPRAPVEDVVVAFRPAPADVDLAVPTPEDEAAAERAAALFLEQRAARIASGSTSNDMADSLRFARQAAADSLAPSMSRLDRFKARRSGARA